MDIRVETHGPYEIKSGRLSGGWTARAIRRKAVIAEARGASRDEAVEEVKAELDRLHVVDRSECDAEGAPSAAAYERAFLAILPTLNPNHRRMLEAHLRAPDHLISATKLAEAAGYAGYEAANLQYGLLGQRVAREIGFAPPKREDGTEIWTCAIARDPSLDTEFPQTSMLDSMVRSFGASHFEWQMRPQVVQALRALGF